MCDSSGEPRPQREATPRHGTPTSAATPVEAPLRRWTAVDESAYPHERAALEHLRAAMPDTDPWRAWSNLSFATAKGELYEIDLLIAAPSGLHMVELKAWNGEVTETPAGWVQTNAAGERIHHGHPLRLAFHKSGALARLLEAVGEHAYIRTLVAFSDDRLRTYLSGRSMRRVVRADALIPQLSRPSHDARDRMTSERVERISRALEFAGIVPSDTPLWPVSRSNG